MGFLPVRVKILAQKRFALRSVIATIQNLTDFAVSFVWSGVRSNLTSQDVTVTFSVDMSSFNGEFADVSLQGGTAPLDWFPGSMLMIDPEQDGIYTVDVLFPAGSGKMVEYKFTALTDTGWFWENFAGNRSFEIDDSSPIQRLRLDSWISGGVTTAALGYSFDKTTSDPLVSTWATGSGQMNLSDNTSIIKEGIAALQADWTINHGDDWGVIYSQLSIYFEDILKNYV